MRHLLIFQGVLVAAAAVGCYYLQGTGAALAALYGGGIAVVNTLLLLWHQRRAERLAGDDAGRNMRILYRCAFERFASTVVLLALGLIWLRLPGPALLGGFVAGQLAPFFQGLNKRF